MARVKTECVILLLAMLGFAGGALAAPGPVLIDPNPRFVTPGPNVTEIRIDPSDVPLLVGANRGYGLRIPGMGAAGAKVIGMGFEFNRTSAAPLFAETPSGQLITLVPGKVPTIALPDGSPVAVSAGLPPLVDMVVAHRALYGIASDSGAVYRYSFADDTIETFGSKGGSSCQFRSPGSIAVDAQGRIYIGDQNRIVRLDDISGSGLATFGKSGNGPGQFTYIRDIAVDTKARIYAVDALAHRLVRIDNMLGEGWSELSYDQPECVVTDRSNRIYVCEPRRFQFSRIDGMDGSGKVMPDLRAQGWEWGPVATATITARERAEEPIR